MRLRPGLGSKRIFGVFRAHGTCLVAANVVLPRLGKLTAALPQIAWLDLKGHFAVGTEGRGEIDGSAGAVLGRQNTSSEQPPPNMAAANFVVITNGEGCALNGTAVAAVLIDQ